MIPAGQIARLAELYDRYNNALDPVSRDCKEAKLEFDELADSLFATHASDVKFIDFRYELVSRCREYLRKNRA